MQADLKLDGAPFINAFRGIMEVTSRDLQVEFDAQVKGFITEAIDILPPASGKSSRGEAARKKGEAKVEAKLSRLFAGVTLVGQRQITKVFGKTPKTPVYVKTKERYPDVTAEWKRLRGDKASRAKAYRSRLYVSAPKLEKLKARERKKVGTLAAGMLPVARRYGARVPRYMSRHAPGDGAVEVRGAPKFRVRMTNRVSYAGKVPNLETRLQWALGAQARKMERQLPYILRKREQLAKLQARAGRV